MSNKLSKQEQNYVNQRADDIEKTLNIIYHNFEKLCEEWGTQNVPLSHIKLTHETFIKSFKQGTNQKQKFSDRVKNLNKK